MENASSVHRLCLVKGTDMAKGWWRPLSEIGVNDAEGGERESPHKRIPGIVVIKLYAGMRWYMKLPQEDPKPLKTSLHS